VSSEKVTGSAGATGELEGHRVEAASRSRQLQVGDLGDRRPILASLEIPEPKAAELLEDSGIVCGRERRHRGQRRLGQVGFDVAASFAFQVELAGGAVEPNADRIPDLDVRAWQDLFDATVQPFWRVGRPSTTSRRTPP
jgi:hypothetical protein